MTTDWTTHLNRVRRPASNCTSGEKDRHFTVFIRKNLRVFQILYLTNMAIHWTSTRIKYRESTTPWITFAPRTDFKHVMPMFGRWHRLLFTLQERRIRHRQARSDYGHIKVDFTFTCHVLPVSSRLPHNQTSRAVPCRRAFHCMVELVTSSIIRNNNSGEHRPLSQTLQVRQQVKKFLTSYTTPDSQLCSQGAANGI
jgi:hypothetical protein